MQPTPTGGDFDRLLSPRGVAIVGASEDVRRIGGEPVRYLAEFGYRGGIYPVNPGRSEIRGLKCYPDVASVPQPCDVAIIAVGARHVPQVIHQCGANQIPYAIVLSSGFREAGAEGIALEAEFAQALAATGVRAIGPNCLGLINLNARAHCGFGSGFQYPDLKPGPIAMVTQSGGYGATMMMRAQDAGLGMSYFVSTGNAADIGILDLVAYFLERDDVEVVSLFIEGVSDGHRLRALGRRALELRKPILVCKAGNSETGRQAAASHTATLTAHYALYRAAFDEGGYIEIRDADDLIDLARAFLGKRLPRGNRVVVVTGSGGAGVIASDRCEEHGLTLPPLAEPTLARLRALLPGFASAANPVDISGQRSQSGRSVSNGALEIVLEDPAADQVIVRSKQSTNTSEQALELAAIAQRAGKPVLVALGPDRDTEGIAVLDRERIPWHGTMARAAVAAGALHAYAKKLARHAQRRAPERPLARMPLPLLEGVDGALSEHDSQTCLAVYGIATVHEVRLARDAIAALQALPAGMRFPVAVKIDSPDIAHKTEAGGVVLNVRTFEELQASAEQVIAAAQRFRPDAHIHGVLIAEMAYGLEMIMGALNDPHFGPVITLGMGGVYTELLDDVTHRYAPFDLATAHAMIAELRAARLLIGYRGKPAHDVDALADTLVRFSWLVADHARQIAEIDVNPLFVGVAGAGATAADALIIRRGRGPRPHLDDG